MPDFTPQETPKAVILSLSVNSRDNQPSTHKNQLKQLFPLPKTSQMPEPTYLKSIINPISQKYKGKVYIITMKL